MTIAPEHTAQREAAMAASRSFVAIGRPSASQATDLAIRTGESARRLLPILFTNVQKTRELSLHRSRLPHHSRVSPMAFSS